MIRITKEFSFEMSHILEGYDGLCSQIHGHSYRLLVTVEGEPLAAPGDPKEGMVMDFGELKRIVGRQVVERYDHSLVIRRTPATAALVDALCSHLERVIEVDYRPTCENMAAAMAAAIAAALPPRVRLHSLRLYETASSYAEWRDRDE